MKVPFFLLPALAALFLGLAAPAAAQSGAKDPAVAKDPVVAKVGGTEIRRSEVEELLEAYGDSLGDLPPQERFATALERVIDMHLIAAAAREAGLHRDPDVKRQLAAAERDVLQEAYVTRLINRETSEKALRERYDRVYHGGKGIREVQVRHILTYTKGKAEEMARRLDAGADFARLAQENSVDNRTAAKGGELGWIGKHNAAPAFAKAALALPVGKFTKEPVETEHGWHVIKVEAERFEKGPTFEQAKNDLAQAAVEETLSEVLRKLREDVKIERLKDAAPAKKD